MNWLDEIDLLARGGHVFTMGSDRWLRMSEAFREMQKALEQQTHNEMCVDARMDDQDAKRPMRCTCGLDSALAKARAVTEGEG
jgi:hypothetical protein